jgi:hypothetical protein
MVLVPEVATRLVMDDMKVGEERAREIMEESNQLGLVVQGEDQDESRFMATQAA